MDLFQRLQHDIADCLRTVPALGDAVVIVAMPRIIRLADGSVEPVTAPSIQEHLQAALSGLESGPTGKSGLVLEVMRPQLANAAHLAPAQQLRFSIAIRIIENVLINTSENGTGLSGNAAALEVVKALHHQQLSRRFKLLPQEGNTLVPLVINEPHLEASEATFFTWLQETQRRAA